MAIAPAGTLCYTLLGVGTATGPVLLAMAPAAACGWHGTKAWKEQMKRNLAAGIGLLLAVATLLALVPKAHQSRVLASPSAQHTIYLPLVVRTHRPVQPTFGVRMQEVSDAFGLPEAVQAGVHTVSAVTFSWKQIEPVDLTPAQYDFGYVDEDSLLSAAANGLELIGTIHHTPDWAQALPGYSCGPILPDKLDDFAEFLQALVSRYSVEPYNVRHWAIWNEPDIDWRDVAPTSRIGCWGDKNLPDFGGSAYGQMLQVAYPAIKAASPHARVIAGNLLLNDPVSLSSKFAEGILQGGGGPFLDVLAFHGYSYYGNSLGKMGNLNWSDSVTTAIPEKVSFLRSVLDAYGLRSKPIMTTEASMLIVSNNPTPDALETQAMYMPRVYAEGLSLGLEGVVYYSMTDDWTGRNNGLLKPDLAAKPSYHAYKTAASYLSQAYYAAPASGYPQGIEGHAFALPTGQDLDVIWCDDGTYRTVTLPAGALAYDRYGAGLGGGAVQVGYSPVYVVKP